MNLKKGDVLIIARNDGDVFDSISDGAYRIAVVVNVWGDSIDQVSVYDSVSTHNLGAFDKRLIIPSKLLYKLYDLEIDSLETQLRAAEEDIRILSVSRYLNGEENYDSFDGEFTYQEMEEIYDNMVQIKKTKLERVKNQKRIIERKVNDINS